MKETVDKYKVPLCLLALCIVSFLIITPILRPGMFVSDDGNWMVVRFAAFYHALRAGQFPVRFLPQLNFGYGYPVATFLYPGFMYLGAPIKALGLGFVTTVKILFGIGIIGQIICTYLWLRKRFSGINAIIGTIVSTFTPYFLYDIYSRGSLGEVLAIATLPFILWMIERRSIFWIGTGIFALILFHNTLALLFLPVILLYGLLSETRRTRDFLIPFVLGGLSAAFFAVPAILELHLTQFAITPVSNPLLYFAQIKIIGWPLLVILLVTLGALLLDKKDKRNRRLVPLFLILGLISIFMASALSRFLWEGIPASFVQFPFRFLSYIPVTTAFLTSFVIGFLKTKKWLVVAILSTGIVVFTYGPWHLNIAYQNQPDGYYATSEATTTVKDEYMPRWVKDKPSMHPVIPAEFAKGSGTIENVVDNGRRISLRATSETGGILQLNIIYWPGWKATVDGKPQAISYANPGGLMTFPVSAGSHDISIRFGETILRLLADMISVLAFFILLAYALKAKVKTCDKMG